LVLNQNQPNPFNPTTYISFALPEAGHVTLRIYDAQGHLVRTLVNEERAADYHVAQWDGRDDAGVALSSGVYLYRLETARTVLQQKMVLRSSPGALPERRRAPAAGRRPELCLVESPARPDVGEEQGGGRR
jgi:hypothetical protein